MTTQDNADKKRFQSPCIIDGQYFRSISAAFQYLQEVDGRIKFEHFVRFVKQGRRILNGHVLSIPEKGVGNLRSDSQ
jgi:hypothetical protein